MGRVAGPGENERGIRGMCKGGRGLSRGAEEAVGDETGDVGVGRVDVIAVGL